MFLSATIWAVTHTISDMTTALMDGGLLSCKIHHARLSSLFSFRKRDDVLALR